MKSIYMKTPIAALMCCIVAAVMVAVVTAGSDFVYGELRVDLSAVYGAGDYRVTLLANDNPSSGSPSYTTAWLGFNLAQYNGQPFSGQFSQVGLLTRNDGIHWFVYAEPGVTCLLGSQYWGTCNGRSCGCLGNVSNLVSLNTWHLVELVTYGQGYWIARVNEANGNAHDVAQIWSSSTRIYRAGATTEEAYTGNQDPYLTASFYHWHPQYMASGVGFQEWPASAGGNNSFIHVTDLNGQNTFCPQHYGATPNILGDERLWFAETGGQQCSWLLFPSVHIYLPTTLKDYP
jgi:hypothetical protein